MASTGVFPNATVVSSNATTAASSSSSTLVDGRVKEVIVDARINKILSLRTDSVAMLEAMDSIASFYKANTVDARHSLRHDLELQNIQIANKFLVEFDKIKEKVDAMEDNCSNLQESCQRLSLKVSQADQNMKSFMDKASQLEIKQRGLVEQSSEIATFLSKFQLSPDELDTLYRASLDSPSTANAFFEALHRLRKANIDCKTMVQRHCYSAGFELLDSLGQHQDFAYQRLFEWVKQKCDILNESQSASSEDIDAILQVSIKYLRKLPVYYSQCQELIIQSRRSQLVQKFIQALTQGGPTGQLFRAIDMHSHDPVRYIGEMLAWMHQTLASEEELIQAMFGGKGGSNNNNASISSSSGADKNNDGGFDDNDDFVRGSPDNGESDGNIDGTQQEGYSFDEMLARCFQGLGRPLRVRIMQSLEAQPAIETQFVLIDLLSFYETTFSSLISIENAVHSTVKGCLLECRRMFQASMSRQAEALSISPSSYPLDLSASHSTKECTKQLRDIFKASTSALSNVPFDSDDNSNLETVVGSIIPSILTATRMSGQSLPPSDMAIFMLNNVALVQNELKAAAKIIPVTKSQAATKWLASLEMEIETWLDILINEESDRTLRRSDMDKLLELANIIPEGICASEQPGLSADRCATVLRAFYSSLLTTFAPQFERLSDSNMREVARKKCSLSVYTAYCKVHGMISNTLNKYDAGMLTHSKEEVKVILGC